MELRLARYFGDADGTRGDLFVDGVPCCNSLEDVVRLGPKIAHETAIPAGRYRVKIQWSPRFGGMVPWVLDVPGFEAVEIHIGNTSVDTSGCVLVGYTARTGAEDHQGAAGQWPAGDGRLFHSRTALSVLQPQIARAIARGEAVWLTIANVAPQVSA